MSVELDFISIVSYDYAYGPKSLTALYLFCKQYFKEGCVNSVLRADKQLCLTLQSMKRVLCSYPILLGSYSSKIIEEAN